MYSAPSDPRRAAGTDSPLPPVPLHHAVLSPTHFFLPDTKQFAEFFRQIYHPHPRTGLRFFHQDRLAAQLNYIAPDMQRPLAPVDVRPPQAAGLAPPHARGEDQLEIDFVFQALPSGAVISLCTVSSSATGRSCGALSSCMPAIYKCVVINIWH